MGTILTENSSFDPDILVPNPGEGVRAGGGVQTPITISGADANGDLVYTGLVQNVRIRHLGGTSTPLGVTVSGNDVTVQLATDGLSLVTSTAADVINAVSLTPAALLLLIPSLPPGSTGLGLAGVVDFVAISAGVQGSVRPAFQSLTNRTRWLYGYIESLLYGTISLQSLVVDSSGDNPVTPVPGQISAIAGVFSSLLSAPEFQTSQSQGSHTLPNPTVPLGLLNLSNTLIGLAFVQMLPAPGSALYWGMNVASISHPKAGQCLVTFNVNCSHALPMVVSHGNALFVLSQPYVVSLSPLTIKIIQAYPNTLTAADQDFLLYVVGE